MLWISELNFLLLSYHFALNEGHQEAMPTDTEFWSWLQKCLKNVICKKLLNCSLRLRKKMLLGFTMAQKFLGYVFIFSMFWFRFIPLCHQVPLYGVGTQHSQGLNSVVVLGWEVSQTSPPAAAMRTSLLILPQNMRNRFHLINKLCSSLLFCALRRGGRNCTWNKSKQSFTAQQLSQEQWYV